MSSSDAMKTAQQLIREQRYDEARAILRTLDHPLARSWLESLEGLGSGKNARPRARWRRVIVVVIVLALLAGGVIVYLSYDYQRYSLAQEAQNLVDFSDPRAELQAICDERGYTEEECTAWILSQAIGVDTTPLAPAPPPRENPPRLPGGP